MSAKFPWGGGGGGSLTFFSLKSMMHELTRVFAAHICDKYENLMNWPLGYKTFFMLNSTEHEISTAYKN